MSAPLRCEAILASAGSGKTYAISGRFIALLAAGAEPDEVFASTFTRKAAGEIQSRVLRRLAEGALKPQAAAELTRQANKAGFTGMQITPGDCGRLLGAVVRSLHRLDIGTLDSFFVRAATCYAMELGLPPGWSIADDVADERTRIEAVTELLHQADRGELLALLRSVSTGEADRSVHEALLGLVGDLSGLAHDATDDAWQVVARDAAGMMTRDQIERHIAEAPVDAIPQTQAGKPNSNWVKALQKVLAQLRADRVDDLAGNGFITPLLGDGPTYHRRPYPPAIADWVTRIVDHTRARLRVEFADRAAALHRLAGDIDAHYRAAQHRRGLFRFDDATGALVGESGALLANLDVYYRLDARLRHVLLDEFQDTSRRQWAAMEPLIDEAAQARGERAVLIVADPKQSIYGWRGGEPRIIASIIDRYGLGFADGSLKALPVSYRSSQVVLDAVNKVFTDLHESSLVGDHPEAAGHWMRTFSAHEAARDLPGFVQVINGPTPEHAGATFTPEEAEHAAKLISHLADEAPRHTIGVLVRQNKAVARLRYELSRLGVRSSEEGGNPLTDSPAVVAVVQLIRLADHPGDTLAAYHVAKTPLGRAVGLTDYTDPRRARAVSYGVRRDLATFGYGVVLGRWAEAIAGSCDDRDLNRLLQLVELGWRYDDSASLRPGDFVRLVVRTRVDDPTTARVRVMTIHQSKGLEFDTVVLPDLHHKLAEVRGQLVTDRADPLGPITAVCPRPNKHERALLAEADAVHRAAEGQVMRDSLSALYVAMTRARHALHLVVRPVGGGSTLRMGDIVRQRLAPNIEVEGCEPLFEDGDPAWMDQVEPEDGQSSRAPRTIEPKLPPPRQSRSLPRRTPSQLAGGDTVIADQLFGGGGDAARLRGTAVHAWCEQIEWLDDGLPDRAWLEQIARDKGCLDPVDPLVEAFATMLRGEIAAELTRTTFADGAEVKREMPFAVRLDDGLLTGMIDRLTLERDGDGRVVRAVVHDFKTDRISAGDGAAIDERVAHYTPQLSAYRGATAKLFGIDESAVEAKLLLLDAGVVRAID